MRGQRRLSVTSNRARCSANVDFTVLAVETAGGAEPLDDLDAGETDILVDEGGIGSPVLETEEEGSADVPSVGLTAPDLLLDPTPLPASSSPAIEEEGPLRTTGTSPKTMTSLSDPTCDDNEVDVLPAPDASSSSSPSSSGASKSPNPLPSEAKLPKRMKLGTA